MSGSSVWDVARKIDGNGSRHPPRRIKSDTLRATREPSVSYLSRPSGTSQINYSYVRSTARKEVMHRRFDGIEVSEACLAVRRDGTRRDARI